MSTQNKFRDRTDILARRLGLKLQELPKIIDISPSLMIRCRRSDTEVSHKTWTKLAKAESEQRQKPDHDHAATLQKMLESQEEIKAMLREMAENMGVILSSQPSHAAAQTTPPELGPS